MSQSAVSHAIASMERELGGALVVRGASLTPTPLGHRVLAHEMCIRDSRRRERVGGSPMSRSVSEITRPPSAPISV